MFFTHNHSHVLCMAYKPWGNLTKKVHFKRMKEDNALHHMQLPVTLPSSSTSNGTTILNKFQMQVNGASIPMAAATNGTGTQTNKSGYKIVVNNYHAHSILSGQDNNNIATCLINQSSLDSNTNKLYQQIGDAPMPSKIKHIDISIPATVEKPKTKASKDNDLENGNEVSTNGNIVFTEETSTPNETTATIKSVIVTQSPSQKCEVTGEDDIGSNLDDDDDEDLGGETIFYISKIYFYNQ